jgi:hypothetical protein
MQKRVKWDVCCKGTAFIAALQILPYDGER